MRTSNAILFSCVLMLPILMSAHTDDTIIPVQTGIQRITEISDIPWVPVTSPTSPKVIYGEDDRIDVYQETDTQRLEWASATCALINTSLLTQHPNGSWTISSPGAYRRSGRPPCDGEPFADQPTASYCTGFMVGSDLIATAGHCYSTASISGVRFVFGFWMLDETTPRLDFLESEVYQGVEVVSYASSGSYDHSIVRVDRPITAPGATAFMPRREGTIQPGEYVGVIGHPSGLPMKIAFGDTYVRSSYQDGYFVANLDTYGGNSGSPVINATTGILEGILVRGATDFLVDYENNCFYSNVYTNDEGRGEDVTKATVFAPYIPGPEGHSGVLQLDSLQYRCGNEIWVSVVDPDLVGETTITVDVETAAGDAEALTLTVDTGKPDRFIGGILLQLGDPESGSGILEVSYADVVTVYYFDAMGHDGLPATRVVTAEVDCDTPDVIEAYIGYVSGTQVQICVTTNVVSLLTLYYGDACDNLLYVATSPFNTEHVVVLSDLEPYATYYLAVRLEGQAGSAEYYDNSGLCFQFNTYGERNYFTEDFTDERPPDIEYMQIAFTPVESPNYYVACFNNVTVLPVSPGDEPLVLGDDDFIEVPFTHGADIPFYGIYYDSMFVGSNGYITFGEGDDEPDYNLHFQLPRIAAFMTNLNPEHRGAIYSDSLSDRYVVTFEDVPAFDPLGDYPPGNAHTFQIELFFDGAIRITWLDLYAQHAIAGLSEGLGVPSDFFFTDLTTLTDCAYEGAFHSADIDGDRRLSLQEVLRVAQLYSAGEYYCNPAAEDGYDIGDGSRDCPPHDSDYSPVDWQINLSELLRLIQLYNAGGYRSDLASEDGFNPIL